MRCERCGSKMSGEVNLLLCTECQRTESTTDLAPVMKLKSISEADRVVSKNEFYILVFFILIAPVLIATFYHKDTETFWVLTTVFALGGMLMGTAFIVFVRLFKQIYKNRNT